MGRSSGALALPRGERLRRAEDIQKVFQSGSRAERRTLLALWQPRPGGRQVGFAVSRQVRGAVARNRARRRLREAYRRQRSAFPADLAVVFVGRPPALSVPFTELLGDMRETASALRRRMAVEAVKGSGKDGSG